MLQLGLDGAVELVPRIRRGRIAELYLWAPPGCALGASSIGCARWTAGLVAMQLATGRPFYRGRSIPERVQALARGHFEWPDDHEVDVDLRILASECLRVAREDRVPLDELRDRLAAMAAPPETAHALVASVVEARAPGRVLAERSDLEELAMLDAEAEEVVELDAAQRPLLPGTVEDMIRYMNELVIT
jgi:hypothetical protein